MSLYDEIKNSMDDYNNDITAKKIHKVQQDTAEKFGIGLTVQEKTDRIRDKIDYKEKKLNGFNLVTVESVGDGDGVTVQDEEGNIISGRLTSDLSPYMDSAEITHPTSKGLVQPTEIVNNSGYKEAVQPKQVARLLGKEEEELTNEDYNKVGTWQRDQLIKLLSASDEESTNVSEFYEPTTPMQVPNDTKAYMKIVGQDKHGRPLIQLVNKNTNENVTDMLASNPNSNANFNYSDIRGKDNYLKNNPEKASKADNSYYYDKEYQKIKNNYQNMLADNMDKDGRIGEDIDLLQSAATSGIANAVEGTIRIVNGIANNPQLEYREYLRNIYSKQYPDNPEKVQQLIERDVKSVGGVTPAESMKKFEQATDKVDGFLNAVGLPDLDKLTEKEFTDKWTGVKESTRKDLAMDTQEAKELIATGEIGNVIKGLWKIGTNIDRHLSESFGTSAPLMIPTPAGFAIGVGAFTAGQINEADKEHFKRTGKHLSPEDALKSFVTRLPITAVDRLFLGHLGRNVLGKNKSVVSGFVKPTNKVKQTIKNIGKESVEGGAIEFIQEFGEGSHTDYYADSRDERSIKETLSNFDNLFGGIVGAMTGGVQAGGSFSIGNINNLSESKAKKKEEKIARNITPMSGKPDTEANSTVRAKLDSIHEKEIEEGEVEDLAQSYSEVKELREKNLTSISLDTLKDASRKLSMIKARIAEKGNAEDIANLEEDYTEEEKVKDLEKIIYYSDPKVVTENQDRYQKIGENLGLDKETAIKTINKSMEEVSLESKYGHRGYETYNDVLNNLKERKKNKELSEEDINQLDKSIQNVEQLLSNFNTSQVTKLNQFANGIEALVQDKEKGKVKQSETISYNKDQNKFKMLRDKLIEGDFDNPNGTYKVLSEIINNVEGTLQRLRDQGIEVDQKTMDRYQKGLDRLYNSIDTIKKTNDKELETLPETSVDTNKSRLGELEKLKSERDRKVEKRDEIKFNANNRKGGATKNQKNLIKNLEKEIKEYDKSINELARKTEPVESPQTKTTTTTQANTHQNTKTSTTDQTVESEKGSFISDLANKLSKKKNTIKKDKKSGTVSYKGIPVKENPNLTRKDNKSEPIMAKQTTDDKGNKKIQVNPNNKLWDKKYNEKAWSKPEIEGVTPIETDTFKTVDDFKEFVVEHEYRHTQINRNKNETTAEYENRINKKTLERLGYDTNKVLVKEAKKNTTSEKQSDTKPVINVYYGKKEDSTNTRQLSNLAYRPFTWEGREYQSVEHAYQSNKSGSFDEETYNKYLNSKPKGYGKKIRGKLPNKNSLNLMKELVKESFRQNPEQAKLLTKYSDFTHNNSNAKIDKAFLEGLREAKKEAESTTAYQTESNISTKANTPETTQTSNTDESVDSQEVSGLSFNEEEQSKVQEAIDSKEKTVQNQLDKNKENETNLIVELSIAIKKRNKKEALQVQKQLAKITNKRFALLAKLKRKFLEYVKDNKNNAVMNKKVKNSEIGITKQTSNNKQKVKFRHILKFNPNKATLLSMINVINLTNEAKKLVEAIKKPDKFFKDDVTESPAYGLIYNSEGEVDNNVVSAIALAVEEFMALSSNLLDPQTDDEIASVLGKDKKEVTEEDRQFVRDRGVFTNYIADLLGTKTLELLGLDYNNNPGEIDGKGNAVDTKALYQKLVSDLGNYGIQYMTENSYAVRYGTSINKLSGIIKNINVEKNNSKEVKTLKLHPGLGIDSIQEIKQDYENTVEKVTLEKDYSRKLKPYPSKKEYVPNKKIRNSKGIFEVPSRILNILKQRRDTPFKLNLNVANTVLANEEAVKKYMGYVEDPDSTDALFEDKEGMKGKNRAILRALDDLREIAESGIDTWYSDWFVSRNHRLFMDSNTINMLENVQLHRFLFTSKNNEAEIDMQNSVSRNGYYTALAQSFGVSIDKITPKHRIEIGKKIANELSTDKLTEEFKKGTIEQYIQEQFPDEDIEIESIGHFLSGLNSLEAFKNRKSGKFTTDLKAEFDSKTNGIAIRILQTANKKLREFWGDKVGYFRKNENFTHKKDINKTLAEYATENKILDIYESIAEEVKNSKSNLNKIVNKKIWKRFSPKQQYVLNNVWYGIFGSLPKLVNNEVTSELRKLMKDPVMVFQYGSGINSIKKDVTDKVLKKMLNKYISIKNTKDRSTLTKDDISLEKTFDRLGINVEELQTKPIHSISIKNNENLSLEEIFDIVIGETYGQNIWDVLSRVFEPLIKSNERMNYAFRLMMKQFQSEYDKERNKIMTTSDKSVFTENDNIELIQSLLDKFPMIKTMLGEDNKPTTGLGVFSTKKTTMFSSSNQKEDIYANPVAKFSKENNRAVTPIMKEFAEAVSAGSVLWTHMIDGSVVFKMLEQFPDILTIHDAVLVNPNQSVKVPKVFNAQLYSMNMQYNVMQELSNQLEKVFKDVDGNLEDMVPNKPESLEGIETIKDLLRMVKQHAKIIEDSKLQIMNDNMIISNIDGNSNSQFDTSHINKLLKQLKETTDPKEIKKLQKQIDDKIEKYENVYYSDPINGETEAETDRLIKKYSKGILADKETRLELLDLLEQRSVPLDPEHKEILQELLIKIDNKKFQEIITNIFQSKQEAWGKFTPDTKEVTINVSDSKPSNGDFNPAEVYVHEIIHAVASHVINNASEYNAGLIVKRLEKLYDLAGNHVTIEDFLPPTEEISNYEKAYEDAVRRWEYVFKNPDIKGRKGLNEFLAYGLTHKKVGDKLRSIGTTTIANKKKNIFQHLLDIGNTIIDLFFGTRTFKTLNKDVYTSLVQTMYDLTTANEKSMFGIGSDNVFIEKIFTGINKARQKGDEQGRKAIDKVMTVLDKHTDFEVTKKNPTNLDYTKMLMKGLPSLLFSSKYREVLPDLLRSLGFRHTGTVQNVLSEMYESDNLETMVEGMGRLVDNVDQVAQRYRALISNSLVERFGKLDKTHDKVLAEVGLEADLSSLFPDHSVEDIDEILSDEKRRNHVIDGLLQYIRKNVDTETYNYYLTQSKELGNFLLTGLGNESTLTNATNIAKGLLTDKKLKPSKKMIKTIDQLSTLFAIQEMDKEAINKYLSLSAEGKDLFYKTHNQYKQESIEGVLDNQDIHYVKGHVKYFGDQNISVEIGRESEETEFKKRLYKPVKAIKNSATKDGDRLILYVNKLKATQNYDKGAFSLYNLDHMGANILDTLNSKEDKEISATNVFEMKQKLYKNTQYQVRQKMKGASKDKNATGYVPIFDLEGNIKDYRIMMHSNDKKEIFNYDVSGIRALGNMYATNAIKQTAQEINKNTLDIVFKDMDENFTEGQQKGRNNKIYVKVSPDSHDPKIAEYYRLLPEKIKRQIEESPQGEIAVREDLLLQYFGIRDMSILDIPGVERILPTTIRRTVKFTEEVMKTIVPIYKASIILKTATVPVGNFVANVNLSIMYNRDPVTIFKKYRENLKYLNDYIDDERKLMEISHKQKIGEATKQEIDSLPRIKDRLKNSPIAILMEKGMYQTIVEDLSQSEIKSNNRLIKKIDEKTEFVPEFIKTGVKHLYLAEGTPIYNFMAKTTQYSDFLGRATEYQLRVEAGVDPDQAAEEAMTMFINYNKPSSAAENYVNKMGLWMFTKFGKRIQRVLTTGLTKSPVSATLALFFQNFLIETENIGEQQFLLKNWSANWYTPVDILEGALIQPHMKFIGDVID